MKSVLNFIPKFNHAYSRELLSTFILLTIQEIFGNSNVCLYRANYLYPYPERKYQPPAYKRGGQNLNIFELNSKLTNFISPEFFFYFQPNNPFPSYKIGPNILRRHWEKHEPITSLDKS